MRRICREEDTGQGQRDGTAFKGTGEKWCPCLELLCHMKETHLDEGENR